MIKNKIEYRPDDNILIVKEGEKIIAALSTNYHKSLDEMLVWYLLATNGNKKIQNMIDNSGYKNTYL